jgi:hypothetical protein
VKNGDCETAMELLDTADERAEPAFAELALDAYCAMNALDDKILDENDMSRHDIERGIKRLAREHGFSLWKTEE